MVLSQLLGVNNNVDRGIIKYEIWNTISLYLKITI